MKYKYRVSFSILGLLGLIGTSNVLVVNNKNLLENENWVPNYDSERNIEIYSNEIISSEDKSEFIIPLNYEITGIDEFSRLTKYTYEYIEFSQEHFREIKTDDQIDVTSQWVQNGEYLEAEILQLTDIEIIDYEYHPPSWGEDFGFWTMTKTYDHSKTTDFILRFNTTTNYLSLVSKEDSNTKQSLEGWTFNDYYEFAIRGVGKDGVLDSYSFANDEYNLEETQKRMNEGGTMHTTFANSEEEIPFFTEDNTFIDLENYIREGNIIASRDNVPLDSADIIFYDKEGNIINENKKLYSSNISFKLISNETQPNIVGESPTIELQIPYVNINLEQSDPINIYDFKEYDIIANETQSHWVFENEKWTLKTNVPFTLDVNSNNIYSYKLNDENEYVLQENEEQKIIDHKQIDNNESQTVKHNVTLTNVNDYEFPFTYEFNAQNGNIDAVDIETLNGSSIVENELMTFDENSNNQTEGVEIYNANVVDNSFEVKNFQNVEHYEYDNEKGRFIINNSPLKQYNDPGLYAFSSLDEFGNKRFEIVEFNPNARSSYYSNSQLNPWDSSDSLYLENLNIAKQQGMSEKEFNSKQSQEQIVMDYQAKRMQDLSDIKINNTILEEITRGYSSGITIFDQLEQDLEQEIINQLKDYELSAEDFKINWMVNGEEPDDDDDDELHIGDMISYEIVTSGNWQTFNSYRSWFYFIGT